METNVVICVLIGLPGAGKTTMAAKITDVCCQSVDCPVKIIKFSFDDFLPITSQEKLVAECKMKLEPHNSFKEVRTRYVTEVGNIIFALKNGDSQAKCLVEQFKSLTLSENQKYVLILDDNFYYKSMRYKIYQLASTFNCGFCQVYLECSPRLAKERNQTRFEKVSEVAILTMSQKIEPPNPCSATNLWETQSISISSEDVNAELSNIYNFIVSNFEKGLSAPKDDTAQRKEAQLLNHNNLLHRSDLILRTVVGEKICVLKQRFLDSEEKDIKTTMKEASTAVNSIRRHLLAQLTNNTLLVPLSVFQSDGLNVNELYTFLQREFDCCFEEHNFCT